MTTAVRMPFSRKLTCADVSVEQMAPLANALRTASRRMTVAAPQQVPQLLALFKGDLWRLA